MKGILFLAALALAGTPALAAGADWKILFDGRSVEGWRTWGKPADAPVAWVIEGDAFAWRKGCGFLATKEEFGDFELELEWKISPGGNSGIIFRAFGNPDRPWKTGPEIQLLDDARHPNGRKPTTRSGAIYDLYPPLRAADRPVGEWNRLRLKARGNHIQIWQNDQPIIDVVIGSGDWNERVARSKFSRLPDFVRIPRGAIVLQDHGNPVWFRRIRVRAL